MGATDLGGASPIWMFILLAIVAGPFVWSFVYGLMHRDSGAPRVSDASEAAAFVEIAKDLRDVQNGGKGW